MKYRITVELDEREICALEVAVDIAYEYEPGSVGESLARNALATIRNAGTEEIVS